MAGKKDFAEMLARAGGAVAPSTKSDATARASTEHQTPESRLMDRLAKAGDIAERGGLLNVSAAEFTREAAERAGRPVRKHKVAALCVHPQNPRPISGEADLDDLRSEMRRNGQKDPIHIVPYNGGWGIMEGQRRWLVAKLEGLEELDCFEHPSMSALEVFAFGMSIHRTRANPTAIDESRSLEALLAAGISRTDLIEFLSAEGLKYSPVDLTRMLAITGSSEELLQHVIAKPKLFSHRHLYALARLEERAGAAEAAAQAAAVRNAPEDRPVSAVSIERILERAGAGTSGKRSRMVSIPKTIRSEGLDVGMCRGYASGKIEFTPALPITAQESEALHAAVALVIENFFSKRPPASS